MSDNARSAGSVLRMYSGSRRSKGSPAGHRPVAGRPGDVDRRRLRHLQPRHRAFARPRALDPGHRPRSVRRTRDGSSTECCRAPARTQRRSQQHPPALPPVKVTDAHPGVNQAGRLTTAAPAWAYIWSRRLVGASEGTVRLARAAHHLDEYARPRSSRTRRRQRCPGEPTPAEFEMICGPAHAMRAGPALAS